MKSRLVRVGNSRGVRIPKSLIEEAGLEDQVDIRARGRAIVITPGNVPRAGWREAAARLNVHEGGKLLDPPSPTRFDRSEWEW